ncbi:hypothetical protein KZO11_38270 [Streptomyces anulatus]|uniref:hypothetical protein n=1 Tax=Streptomyces anulatus TaxID=1892 RepID=UPI001C5E6E3F|nr:hypothetical protein [Streptomyces anulatus]QYA98986.1 hypothetical protein KZO11_38270 [Streptomyces anulatus]
MTDTVTGVTRGTRPDAQHASGGAVMSRPGVFVGCLDRTGVDQRDPQLLMFGRALRGALGEQPGRMSLDLLPVEDVHLALSMAAVISRVSAESGWRAARSATA